MHTHKNLHTFQEVRGLRLQTSTVNNHLSVNTDNGDEGVWRRNNK